MKMKKKLIIPAIIIPILIFLVIVNNYSKDVERSMVAGTYIANYDKLKSTLVIKEDGTYDYYLETEDGEKYFNSNIWDYDVYTGRSKIILSEFKYSFKPYNYTKEGIRPEPWIWARTIYSDYRGRIKITIDGDRGLYYLKQ